MFVSWVARTRMLAASIKTCSRSRARAAKRLVADADDLVEQNYFRLYGRADAKCKAQHHPLGVAANREFQIIAKLGELRNIIHKAADLRRRQSEKNTLIRTFSYPVASPSIPTLRSVSDEIRPMTSTAPCVGG